MIVVIVSRLDQNPGFVKLGQRKPVNLAQPVNLMRVYMSLTNKVAIVTGAASGIGKAIALEYAQAGAKVVIADLSLDAAKRTADEIIATGAQAMAVAMNVADEAQVDGGVARVLEQWGGVDILVSNAGIQIISALVDLSLSDWQRLMSIHVDGAFLTTRACMRAMIKSGKGGSIIYMGSVHSHLASPLKAPYVTAKHGLLGLAKVVAKEGAKDNIRANVICPGFVRTPLVDKQIPEQAQSLGISENDVIKKVMLKDTVDGEFTTVQDVAKTALFLASFESNALTGQSITVSHGWHMQ
jgi:3-hydroxybutyrate dehydrogenase